MDPTPDSPAGCGDQGEDRNGSHVRCCALDEGGALLLSLRHRHGQPAALHRGLLAVVDKTTREFPWRRQSHLRRVRTAPGPHPPDSGPVKT